MLTDDATVADLALYPGEKEPVAEFGIELVHEATVAYSWGLLP